MLINGIFCNSEVLYGLNQKHIEMLESVDKYFWRKVFRCPFSTPTEIFFMETNSTPFRFVLVTRRLMYYWNILQMDESELVKRVFIAQKISSCRNDWVIQISEDLKVCNISYNEEELRKMKRFTYKKLIKQKVREAFKVYLLKIRNDPNRSKSKNLWPVDEMQ